MPTYPTNTIVAHYTGPLGSHRMRFWSVLGVEQNGFVQAVRDVINELVDCQYTGTVWHSADFQQQGFNFSTPIGGWVPIEQLTTGINPTANDTVGEYINFVGRSGTTGKRTRLFLFEVPFGPGTDMRLQDGASALIDQVVNELTLESARIGVGDGTPAVWKSYVNLGINDYWIRQARQGG